LTRFAPQMLAQLQRLSILSDVNSDQQNRGLQASVEYDRETAARFRIAPQLIDNTLYDAFGQRQVSTMYRAQNQYHVVMAAAPRYGQGPLSLDNVWIKPPTGNTVPLSTLAHYASATAPLAVNHQGLFPAATVSFNLRDGVSLSDAVRAIDDAAAAIHLPSS